MRVLQLRDRLHILTKQEPNRTRGDEVVFQFETILLFVSATFDATASVADIVYLGGDGEDAAWRRPGWLQRLEPVAPDLAALVADGSAGAALLQLIGALRNTIHGEALRMTDSREPGGLTAQFVRLSKATKTQLEIRIEALGDSPARWGLREVHREPALAPDRFSEKLLPRAVKLLNALMAETKTELLPGVSPSDLRGPPEDVPNDRWWDDMFSFEIRRRVRLLGGI